MTNVFSDTNDIEFDLNNAGCRQEVEKSFYAVLADLGNKGWHPGEVAMAMADVAEDFIMAFPAAASRRH